MNTEKLNDWLQLAAAVGVLVGLLLVAYELRQQQELVRAQLGSDAITATQEQFDSFQDVATARAYVKALEAPDTLTLEEQVILHSLFAEVLVATVTRHRYLNSLGVFEAGLAIPANSAAGIILGSEYGRQWWAVRRRTSARVIVDALDAAATDRDSLLMNSAALIKQTAQQQMEQQR